MYCKHCGKQITDDAVYCKYCGNRQDIECQDREVSSMAIGEHPAEQTERLIGTKNKKSHKLAIILIASITISIALSTGYAIIRHEDSLPYDLSHYWGSSVYDTKGSLSDGYQRQLTWMRQEGYERGIKNMAIYSFISSFAILVVMSLTDKKR